MTANTQSLPQVTNDVIKERKITFLIITLKLLVYIVFWIFFKNSMFDIIESQIIKQNTKTFDSILYAKTFILFGVPFIIEQLICCINSIKNDNKRISFWVHLILLALFIIYIIPSLTILYNGLNFSVEGCIKIFQTPFFDGFSLNQNTYAWYTVLYPIFGAIN